MKRAELKRTLVSTLIVSAIGMSAGGTALAADSRSDTSSTTGSESAAGHEQTRKSAEDLRASKVIGMRVVNPQNENLGKIDDLVVNLGNGKLHYAVLDLGKPWTINDTLVPMSMASFTVPADQRKDLVANVTKDQIDLSQGFKERRWPDLNDPTYQRRVDTYLSSRSSTSSGAAGPVRE